MKKREKLAAVVCAGIVIVVLIIVYGYFDGWYVKVPGKKYSYEVDFTKPVAGLDNGYEEDYSRIVRGIIERKKQVELSSQKAADVMMFFKESSPVSFLVKSYKTKGKTVSLDYTFWKNKQNKYIDIVENILSDMLRKDEELSSALGKRIVLYNNLTSYFGKNSLDLSAGAGKNIANALINKKISEKDMCVLLAFLYAQVGDKAEVVASTDQPKKLRKLSDSFQKKVYGVYLTSDDGGYYAFPGQEIRHSSGKGLMGFGNNNESADYYFYHKEYSGAFKSTKSKEYFTKSASLLSFRSSVSYKTDGKDMITLTGSNESVIRYNVVTGEREVILDCGFKLIKTEDKHKNYLYIPKEASVKNKRPMIICLHGALEASVARGKYGVPLKDKKFQKPLKGAFILVMESVKDYYQDAKRYNEIVREILSDNPEIDADKIMIYGFSNGSAFACDMLVDAPELYKGAMLSGCLYRWDDEPLERVKNLHFWLMNGENDEKLIVDSEWRMKEQMEERNMDISFHEFKKCGHAAINVFMKIDELGMSAVDWLCDRLDIK